MPILCLEANWNGRNISPQSVHHTLETMSDIHNDTCIHIWCNTKDELKYALRDANYGFRQGFLYMAFHGSPGRIQLGNKTHVTMTGLADLMENRFQGWNVHFGSCRTMDTLQAEPFKKMIGARILTGYTKSVDWIQSTAMDMLLLDQMYRHKTPGYLRNKMQRLYRDLAKLNGLVVL